LLIVALHGGSFIAQLKILLQYFHIMHYSIKQGIEEIIEQYKTNNTIHLH